MHAIDNRYKTRNVAENWVRLVSHYIHCCRFLPSKARGPYRFELKDFALVTRTWLVVSRLVIVGISAPGTVSRYMQTILNSLHTQPGTCLFGYFGYNTRYFFYVTCYYDLDISLYKSFTQKIRGSGMTRPLTVANFQFRNTKFSGHQHFLTQKVDSFLIQINPFS